jgi:hypothetical protein
LNTSPFEDEDDHSEVDALRIALNDLTDEMNTPNESEDSTNEIMTEMMNDSLQEDMVHHEEAIEAIRRELARADLGSDKSIISKFREKQRNSDRSLGVASIASSKGRGGEDYDDSLMGSKPPGYRDDSERSLGSKLHDSERSMGSSLYKNHWNRRPRETPQSLEQSGKPNRIKSREPTKRNRVRKPRWQ